MLRLPQTVFSERARDLDKSGQNAIKSPKSGGFSTLNIK